MVEELFVLVAAVVVVDWAVDSLALAGDTVDSVRFFVRGIVFVLDPETVGSVVVVAAADPARTVVSAQDSSPMLKRHFGTFAFKQVVQKLVVKLLSCLLEHLDLGRDTDHYRHPCVDQHLGQMRGVARTNHDKLHLCARNQFAQSVLVKLMHHRGQVGALEAQVSFNFCVYFVVAAVAVEKQQSGLLRQDLFEGHQVERPVDHLILLLRLDQGIDDLLVHDVG